MLSFEGSKDENGKIAESMPTLVVHSVPVAISLLAGLLISLTAWGFLRRPTDQETGMTMQTYDALLTGLLVLGVIGLGIFLAYIVMVG